MKGKTRHLWLIFAMPSAMLVGLSVLFNARLFAAPSAPSSHIDPMWLCEDTGTADPCRNAILAVDMLSPNEGWAVGDEGTVLRWNGRRWTRIPVPTDGRLTGVDVLSESDVWVVGIHGTNFEYFMLHWTGSGWTRYDAPAPNNLMDISMISPTDGFVVGLHGILRWNGSIWQEVDSRGGTAVDMLSDSDGWVVGTEGLLLHWTGGVFVETANPWPHPQVAPTMRDVDVVSANDVWAVGDSGRIWHWNGQNWSNFSIPGYFYDLVAVSMVSGTDGWAVPDSGKRLRWNGTAWVEQGHQWRANDIFMVSANDGWIAGDYGRMSHWDGNAWDLHLSPRPPLGVLYNDIKMLSSQEGWAVGQADNFDRTIVQWDGESWFTSYAQGGNTLQSVDVISNTDGWAVGDAGGVMRLESSGWRSLTPSELPPYGCCPWWKGISMVDSGDVWAVGSPDGGGGALIMHWNGAIWEDIPNSLPTYLTDVDMLSSDEGWAVGDGGTIIQWDSGQWMTHTVTTTAHLNAVDVVSTNDVWVVGSASTILHWDGGKWTHTTSPSGNLRDIDMLSDTEGWAVGAGGFLHWDGASWEAVPSPVKSIRAVSTVSDEKAWAVANLSGAILRYVVFNEDLFLPAIIR